VVHSLHFLCQHMWCGVTILQSFTALAACLQVGWCTSCTPCKLKCPSAALLSAGWG
jgi:hypothetical protein